TTGSSVSGSSLLNVFLATRLSSQLRDGIPDFGNAVSKPLRQFCSLDSRRWIALEVVIPGTHNSSGLAKQYDEHLTSGRLLKDIPASPIHIFCATDLSCGVHWMFKRQECGDYQVGVQDTPDDWRVRTCVAAY